MAKTRKKIGEKKSRAKSQSGGTLFNIRPGDLDELQHIGQGLGADAGCAACVLNQIGFPVDIVDELSGRAARDGAGVFFSTVKDKINEVKNRIDRDAPSAQMYFWGAQRIKGRGGPQLVLSVVPEAEQDWQIPFTSPGGRGLMAMAIDQVFNTVRNGTAAVLALRWADAQARDDGGHYVVIAKSRDGTPYLIEAQSGASQGVHRGMNAVRGYFRDVHPARFITFNNSAPYFSNGNWLLNLDREAQLDLSLLHDGRTPVDIDYHRSVQPCVERTGSYDSALPSSAAAAASMDYEEGAGSEHAADYFHQLQSSSRGGPAARPAARPATRPFHQSQSSRYPNPFGLEWQTGLRRWHGSNIYCDSCGEYDLGASYRNVGEDIDFCSNCFQRNKKGTNPLNLKWQTGLRRVHGSNIYCDSCGESNLGASYRNVNKDIDVCENCFNANRPIKEPYQGGRKRTRSRTTKKRKSAGTHKK